MSYNFMAVLTNFFKLFQPSARHVVKATDEFFSLTQARQEVCGESRRFRGTVWHPACFIKGRDEDARSNQSFHPSPGWKQQLLQGLACSPIRRSWASQRWRVWPSPL